MCVCVCVCTFVERLRTVVMATEATDIDFVVQVVNYLTTKCTIITIFLNDLVTLPTQSLK